MPQESIEIKMLKQQVQLLQQELHSLKQYDSVRTLWNSIFTKLETMTIQQPRIYQQLMFRQSLSFEQIEHQDVGCQSIEQQQSLFEKIDECVILLKKECLNKSNSILSENLKLIQNCFINMQNSLNQKENSKQLIQNNTQHIPTKIIMLNSSCNLETEIKDNQIKDLKKQNQLLISDIQKLTLINNQLKITLEEKDAKLKLLNYMLQQY